MKKEFKSAILNYDKCDEKYIDDLGNYLDQHSKRILDFFELENIKSTINIISTKKQLDEFFSQTYKWEADSSTRGFVTKNGEIYFLSIDDYKNTTHAFPPEEFEQAYLGFKKTLLHEHIHIVNFEYNRVNDCDSTAKYLREGLATYLSGQKEGLDIPFNCTLEDILDRNKSNYNAYYLLTKTLVENYPKTTIHEILQSSCQAEKLLKNELFAKAKYQYNNEKRL